MKDKLEEFYQRLKAASEMIKNEQDVEKFNLILKERREYLDSLRKEEMDKETLFTYIEKDKELSKKMKEKVNGNLQFLFEQNKKMKTIKKYTQF